MFFYFASDLEEIDNFLQRSDISDIEDSEDEWNEEEALQEESNRPARAKNLECREPQRSQNVDDNVAVGGSRWTITK